MGIFEKFFGTKKTQSPDNEMLLICLNKYGQDPSTENYRKVFNEIMEGNSFLVLPSINDIDNGDEWTTLKKDSTLNLTSVFDIDGLKVLGAFSSKENLLNWTKKETQYTAMKSKDVVEFCQANGIDRIVIDSDLPTMFVLERNRDNISTTTIQQNTQVTVGTPMNPINGELLRKLTSNFAKSSVIKEVYHYVMIRNNETILMLGFLLDTYSENSRYACINAVQNAMEGERLDLPLEMFMLNDENWYRTVRGIEDSLIYER